MPDAERIAEQPQRPDQIHSFSDLINQHHDQSQQKPEGINRLHCAPHFCRTNFAEYKRKRQHDHCRHNQNSCSCCFSGGLRRCLRFICCHTVFSSLLLSRVCGGQPILFPESAAYTYAPVLTSGVNQNTTYTRTSISTKLISTDTEFRKLDSDGSAPACSVKTGEMDPAGATMQIAATFLSSSGNGRKR